MGLPQALNAMILAQREHAVLRPSGKGNPPVSGARPAPRMVMGVRLVRPCPAARSRNGAPPATDNAREIRRLSRPARARSPPRETFTVPPPWYNSESIVVTNMSSRAPTRARVMWIASWGAVSVTRA